MPPRKKTTTPAKPQRTLSLFSQGLLAPPSDTPQVDSVKAEPDAFTTPQPKKRKREDGKGAVSREPRSTGVGSGGGGDAIESDDDLVLETVSIWDDVSDPLATQVTESKMERETGVQISPILKRKPKSPTSEDDKLTGAEAYELCMGEKNGVMSDGFDVHSDIEGLTDASLLLKCMVKPPWCSSEDAFLKEKLLRRFDTTVDYGPMVGITRLERYERARKMGEENLPVVVKKILDGFPPDSYHHRSCLDQKRIFHCVDY